MYIETEHLILKEYELADIPLFYQLKSTEEIWKYSTFTPLKNRCEAEEMLLHTIENRRRQVADFMALFEKKENHYIGEAGIIGANRNANRCEIGFNLLPDDWNRGFATEITKGLIKYAFEIEKFERVEALVIEENKASCRVLEKSGFTKEGVLRNFNKYGQGYRNVNYYGMISEDYK